MFTLSERANIGLLFIFAVAEGAGSVKSVSVADVVKQWPFISAGYLEEIVAALRKAGLVQGKKGKGGGYVLARSANDIRMFDILTAIEGPLALMETPTHEKMQGSTFEGWCVSRRLWGKVQHNIEETLKSMTLAELVEEGKQFQPPSSEIRNPEHEILKKSKIQITNVLKI